MRCVVIPEILPDTATTCSVHRVCGASSASIAGNLCWFGIVIALARRAEPGGGVQEPSITAGLGA